MIYFFIFLFLWILSFLSLFYYLYKYYINNKLAFDFWNFYSKNLTFGKVLNELVFKGLNKEQYEVKVIKMLYVAIPIFLCLTIWTGAYYG
jgi:hypothetical protein